METNCEKSILIIQVKYHPILHCMMKLNIINMFKTLIQFSKNYKSRGDHEGIEVGVTEGIFR